MCKQGNVVTGDGLLVESVEPIVQQQQQPIIVPTPIVQQFVPQPIIAPVEVQQPIVAPVSEALLIIAPQVSAPAPVVASISQPPPIVAAAAVIPDVYNNNIVINAPQPKEPEILVIKQLFYVSHQNMFIIKLINSKVRVL